MGQAEEEIAMRDWELFKRPRRKRRISRQENMRRFNVRKKRVAVRMTREGWLKIRFDLYDKLNSPARFTFLFDEENQVIALKPSEGNDWLGYKAQLRDGRIYVSCAAFCKHHNIDMSLNRELNAKIKNGMLIIPLNQESKRL